ncbi:TatD family hydrolase [Acidiphilium sp. AL]|uniref:TatD family hydrolase n=1 Tax=Acidiphilium iwatense TaxID=768198 RepID=A0ABS9E1E6_9PROT|nr:MULTISPECIES: TatD family hydrolase [Acidiphilium]MCF3948831.1 TatD family hydrolase [Acidiphilium iwatense]MCU4161356.1 TatD family hydrolase [Acidiphilium sp. AL]
MLIDSHCHLDYFTEAERPEVIARAHAAGVAEMVTIGTTLSQSRGAIAMAEAGAKIWACVGVHPHHAGEEEPVPPPETIAAMTVHPKVIGIGESGLDYFYDRAPREVQAENFRAHIRAAQMARLPLAIHARDADDDIASILEAEYAEQKFAFLLHCFSSGRRLAERALALGGYVSFSGILTFPKSTELREIARDIPGDRLLVETDSPYLAPVPYRGKRNEPAHIVHTAKRLAEVKGVSEAVLAELTTANFRRLFAKAA